MTLVLCTYQQNSSNSSEATPESVKEQRNTATDPILEIFESLCTLLTDRNNPFSSNNSVAKLPVITKMLPRPAHTITGQTQFFVNLLIHITYVTRRLHRAEKTSPERLSCYSL